MKEGFSEEINKEKKGVIYTFEKAKNILLEDFGVGDLSNIEAYHLRKISEECLKQNIRELESEQKGEITGRSSFDTNYETVSRWLWKLYGIHTDNVPTTIKFMDNTTGKEYKTRSWWWGWFKDKKEIEKYHKLSDSKKKLYKQGHDTSEIDFEVDEAYKEYIKRQREKAHKP